MHVCLVSMTAVYETSWLPHCDVDGIGRTSSHRDRRPRRLREAGSRDGPRTRQRHVDEQRLLLPSFYSDGVGSAGFGASRELAAHQAATELVVSGAVRGFPLLHHQRLMPRVEVPPPFPIYASRCGDVERHPRSLTTSTLVNSRATTSGCSPNPSRMSCWTGSRTTSTKLLSSSSSCGRPRRSSTPLASCTSTLTSATLSPTAPSSYLSDFGLAMSDQFDLTADERAFLDTHRDYYHAEIIWSLSQPLRHRVRQPPSRSPHQRPPGPRRPCTAEPRVLVRALDHLEPSPSRCAAAAYVEFVRRYAQVALVMDAFFTTVLAPHKGARSINTTSPSSSPSPHTIVATRRGLTSSRRRTPSAAGSSAEARQPGVTRRAPSCRPSAATPGRGGRRRRRRAGTG